MFEEISEVYYVFVNRNYNSSVHSLSTRDKIGLEKADEILKIYKKRWVQYRFHSNLPKNKIIDIQYGNLITDPTNFVSKMNKFIGREFDHSLNAVKTFLDPRLKHY